MQDQAALEALLVPYLSLFALYVLTFGTPRLAASIVVLKHNLHSPETGTIKAGLHFCALDVAIKKKYCYFTFFWVGPHDTMLTSMHGTHVSHISLLAVMDLPFFSHFLP